MTTEAHTYQEFNDLIDERLEAIRQREAFFDNCGLAIEKEKEDEKD